jgi:hypothetical protein
MPPASLRSAHGPTKNAGSPSIGPWRPEYGEIEETISPAALDVMSGWILKHVGTKTQVAK